MHFTFYVRRFTSGANMFAPISVKRYLCFELVGFSGLDIPILIFTH